MSILSERKLSKKSVVNKAILTSLSIVFICAPIVLAQASGQSGQVSANDPVLSCMAAQSELPAPAKTKKGPLKVVAHALGGELSNDSKNMLRDSILVFSAQDIDPYDRRTAPDGKPYTLCEATMIDGSMASVIKYPDGSGKVVGGFADGTIIAPAGANTFIVAYPNGVRGKMVKTGSTFKIYRPDDSVTTIKKTMSGDYDMSNDKIGTMGTLRTDQLGMQYEFNSSTF